VTKRRNGSEGEGRMLRMTFKKLEISIVPHRYGGYREMNVRIQVDDRIITSEKALLSDDDFSCRFDDAMERARRSIHEIIKNGTV
jgi:hypothetical protein